MWLCNENKVGRGKELHPRLPGPQASSWISELLYPTAITLRLKEVLSAFKTKFWVPASPVPKSALSFPAPCTCCCHTPALQLFAQKLNICCMHYSPSIHRKWGSSQPRLSVCPCSAASVHSELGTRQVWETSYET